MFYANQKSCYPIVQRFLSGPPDVQLAHLWVSAARPASLSRIIPCGRATSAGPRATRC